MADDPTKIVDLHAAQLAEHFDSVRIFVTWHSGSEDNTRSYETGLGNFYAQLGQVHEWMATQDQYQRNWAIRKDKKTK